MTAPAAEDDDRLVDSHVAALALGGWTVNNLRVWRARHPHLLPVAGRGKRGVALFRWGDVRHALAQMLAERDNNA